MLTQNFRFWVLFAGLLHVSSIDGLRARDIASLCPRNAPDLDNCVLRSADELRPKLKKGIKSLKIPPLDPLYIPKIHLIGGNGPVSLDSTYTNVRIDGLSNYQITKAHVDFNNREIKAEAYVPQVRSSGIYQMNGKILALPINGNGDSSSNYTDVTLHMTLKFKPETKNGEEFWTLDKSDLDLNVKHANIHLNNLFNGNKQLGDTMNDFIRENWQVVFQEMKPTIRDTVKAFLVDSVSKVFKAYSVNELFPGV